MVNHFKHTILFFALILTIQTLEAQKELDIPSSLELEKTLREFYTAERDAKLAAFDTKSSGHWKELLPTIGLTYTFNNQPRPALSWSPLSILDRKDKRKKVGLDREAIILSYDNIIKDKLFQMRQAIQDFQTDLQGLSSKRALLSIDEKLFDIAKAKYDTNLIKPSQFLAEEKKIILSRTRLEEYRLLLLKAKSHLLYLSKWEP